MATFRVSFCLQLDLLFQLNSRFSSPTVCLFVRDSLLTIMIMIPDPLFSSRERERMMDSLFSLYSLSSISTLLPHEATERFLLSITAMSVRPLIYTHYLAITVIITIISSPCPPPSFLTPFTLQNGGRSKKLCEGYIMMKRWTFPSFQLLVVCIQHPSSHSGDYHVFMFNPSLSIIIIV